MAKPKYQEIVDELIKELNRGRLNQGDRFYSEAEIKERFGVSSTTAVKVLNLLQSENWVTRIKGRGTFVAKENHRRVVYLTDLNMAKTQPEWTKVLSVEPGNDPVVRKKMHLGESGAYVVIQRLRMIGDQPVQYTINNINAAYLKQEWLQKLDAFVSVYQRIRDDSGLDPYKLPYAQRNLAGSIDAALVKQYFPQRPVNQTFIQQFRLTYLPFDRPGLLEYAVSYKLPEFWGLQTDSTYGFIGQDE
ncbi:GntR family transcriptional regulator [Lacticaseibacillus parahuelsenbergensis]|uniref:GntR family transcriptional regulator n=1 Tax=Lacticaseibacillus parahuelsenbergensis TaxID=3068305 RepID=A0ABY9L271_9LACO|nr:MULTISPECIES: GntR family transcriptional regulator [Lacticaseibacillus]MDE3283610.1 GntR family transcriptional regulator [Lacticaseibacillus casei]WLV77725.1 GntR family transcriptional regulator [Lacticaseibacillus sp. NCIMB 15471]